MTSPPPWIAAAFDRLTPSKKVQSGGAFFFCDSGRLDVVFLDGDKKMSYATAFCFFFFFHFVGKLEPGSEFIGSNRII